MKFGVLGIVCLLLLTSCGQSDEAKAAELVKQSCESQDVEETESLIRQAVKLDEKFRPYLIAWLKWQGGAEEAILSYKTRGVTAGDLAMKEFEDNYLIQDSYC